MKIYTKTGDEGTTGLFGGPRVSKDHPRIQAYGSVDELNSVLGLVRSSLASSAAASADIVGDDHSNLLCEVQSDLFSIGAQLATPRPAEQEMCLLTSERVSMLESYIDQTEQRLEPLRNFILPGGSLAASFLHVARTVCRRAERDVVALAHEPDIDSGCQLLIVYLNRLGDLLFVLARDQNRQAAVEETTWKRPDVDASAGRTDA